MVLRSLCPASRDLAGGLSTALPQRSQRREHSTRPGHHGLRLCSTAAQRFGAALPPHLRRDRGWRRCDADGLGQPRLGICLNDLWGSPLHGDHRGFFGQVCVKVGGTTGGKHRLVLWTVELSRVAGLDADPFGSGAALGFYASPASGMARRLPCLTLEGEHLYGDTEEA